MAGPDPYRDDPYGERRNGAGDDARPGRKATQPARPAWDAMTYGRPDDVRLPPRTQPAQPPEPEPPAWPVSGEPYGSSHTASPTESYRAAADTFTPDSFTPDSFTPDTFTPESFTPDSFTPEPFKPAAAYPAAAYPAATETFAPSSYTTFEAPAAPPAPSLGSRAEPGYGGSAPADTAPPEPVYVASGLYLDEQHANGTSAWPAGDATAPTPVHTPAPEPAPSARRLPAFGARVAVGLGLGAVVLASLLVWRPAFLGVVAIAVGVATWELGRAVRGTGANPPLIPLTAGGVLMTGLAWWGGTVGLTFGLAVTVLAAMAWRFAEGVSGYGRDITAAALIAVYVPFLGGFAAMLASPDDGHLRVLAVLIAVVLSDTGGYLVGAKLGRHAMAPSVSPKKSWEGLAGSLLAAALGSALVVWLMFDVAPWWGLLFGLAIAVVSVIGDLGESMVKRDLGVKDMSGLLPGHGGVMDRLDSVLLAAPTGFLLLAAIAPVAG